MSPSQDQGPLSLRPSASAVAPLPAGAAVGALIVEDLLDASQETWLYRIRTNSGSATALVRAPAPSCPPPMRLAPLRAELALCDRLDLAWAAVPTALEPWGAEIGLIMRDPGGLPLDRALATLPDLEDRLRVAAAIASAVGQMHRQGLVHRNLKPENILVDGAQGAWLTGFGLATHTALESPSRSVEAVSGTLPYLSPEQTGLVNRPLDQRSDLYSLGVILYRTFTGRFPFEAADPSGWIHAHVAQRPRDPAEVVDLPRPLADVVLKLLAKSPDDRYQTAVGLEVDLRLCLARLATEGAVGSFPLGFHDISTRLLAPSALYGRDAELARFRTAWEGVLAGDSGVDAMFVSGASGAGKSALVHAFCKSCRGEGHFAFGKCDQQKRGIPYASIVQALEQLLRYVLGLPAEETPLWRDRLREVVGANGQLMVNLMPELELLIGPQPDLVALPPRDAEARFQAVFGDLLGVFARPDRPLVLILDDLQWVDEPTLALVGHLVSQGRRGFLLIGTFRDEEVDDGHPLSDSLRRIEGSGARLDRFHLSSLAEPDVRRWLGDAVNVDERSAAGLARLVVAKTGGTPLAAIQFLGALIQDGLIWVDPKTGGWGADLEAIRCRPIADNMVAVMLAKLGKLRRPTRDALRTLACLGTSGHRVALARVLALSEPKVDAVFADAVAAGLVTAVDGGYVFLHDRIQEAAYAAREGDSNEHRHLAIARLMAADGTAPSANMSFELAQHYNRATPLLTDPEERVRAAALNLAAAERAMAAMAHSAAAAYLSQSMALLDEHAWSRQRALAFRVALRRAECLVHIGEHAAADEALRILSGHAESLVDLAAVCRMQADLYTMTGAFDRAVAVGLHFLNRLGVEVPSHPTLQDVERQVRRLRERLGSRAVDDLLTLPDTQNTLHDATMDLLSRVLPAALYTNRLLHSLIVVWMANLTLKHGLCDDSSIAFIMLSRVLGPSFGDYALGFHFGRVGYALMEARNAERLRPSATLCFAVFCSSWMRPARTIPPLLRRSLAAAQAVGDVTYAAYSYNNLIASLLLTGDHLDDVLRTASEGLALAQSAKFGLGEAILQTQLALVRGLVGKSPDPTILANDADDEDRFVRDLEDRVGFELPLCWFWLRKLQACVLLERYEAAQAAARRVEPLLWVSADFMEEGEFHFYGALAAAGGRAAAGLVADGGRSALAALKKHHAKLAAWAVNCPETFENRAALIAAEIAGAEGRVLEAQSLYERAAALAHQAGLPHVEALASECAARFYASRGLDTLADAYKQRSLGGYARWGARAKLHQFESRTRSERPREPSVSVGQTVHAPLDELDLANIVRASQALSSAIMLDDAIRTLMTIVLEQTGGERAILLLKRAGDLGVAAEALTRTGAVEVLSGDAVSHPLNAPFSILQATAHTRTSVYLDDVQRSDAFAQDDYIQRVQPRSLLSLPLLKQGRLVGVLYLENRLIAGVFTPRRMAVLELLAAQAAISLENGRLYSDLIEENQERRRAEQALRASEEILALGQQISRTGSWRLNTATGQCSWSRQLCDMLEFDASLRSPTMDDVHDRVHPEERDLVEEEHGRAISERRSFALEHRVLLPSGVIKNLVVVGHPEASDLDQLYYVGTVMDVTERKRSEEALRTAQANLAQTARLTMLGEITASIAHEVNQPLTAMVANAGACLRWLSREPINLDTVRETVQTIVRDGKRAGEIIKSIRRIARNPVPSVATFDLNATLEEMLAILAGDVERYRVLLLVDLSPGLPSVPGDRIQLQQVFLNLVTNALEAMQGVDGPRVLRVASNVYRADWVRLVIEDNGPGIGGEHRDRIFDPFFTTKEDGMGIGLSICRTIVDSHGGTLSVRPAQPCGSVFELCLPLRVPDFEPGR